MATLSSAAGLRAGQKVGARRVLSFGRRVTAALLLLGILVVPAWGAEVEDPVTGLFAPVGAESLAWWTADAGGGRSLGPNHIAVGTIGQLDACRMAGGGLSLEAGFWAASVVTIFGDGFESGNLEAWSNSVPAGKGFPAAYPIVIVSRSTVAQPRSRASTTPLLIDFQGRLTDAAGQPIHGTVEVLFTLWDAAVDGVAEWQEQHAAVEVTRGLFYVTLGSIDPGGNPLTPELFGGPALWLGVAIEGGPEMTGRQPLTIVPRARRVAITDGVAMGGLTGDMIGAGEIRFELLAPSCAENQVLVMTAAGWECGEYAGQVAPAG